MATSNSPRGAGGAPDPAHATQAFIPANDGTIDAARRTGNADADAADLSFLQPSTRPDSLGRIGQYEVLQLLGTGAFGIVFRARDEKLERVVALKVLAPQVATTSPARKRFLREARASAAVRHENVVQVYEVAEQPLPYIAMEFIPGETLQQRLDRTGPLEVAEVLRIGRQIAEGLAAAHATDLIHRDIKPANVLIEGGKRVKITDFGLARAADDASGSQSGVIAGSPMYMAPEQARGESIDQRADLFSLGSVLYQMVAGRPPFRANGTMAVLKRVSEDEPRPIRELIPEAPPWLCSVIARLHAKKPGDRFQSAREVADLFADCEDQLKAHGKVNLVPGIPISKPAAGRSGRWKWCVAAALALPVFILAVTELLGLTHLFLNRSPQTALAPIVKNTQTPSLNPANVAGLRLPEPELTLAEKRIAALPAAEQVAAVHMELQRQNPGFAARLEPTIENDVVTELEFDGANVKNIAALRALRQLQNLSISNGPLIDLTPLRGLNLTKLYLSDCYELKDLTPLRGMPLEVLHLWNWSGSDLKPLEGMPLKVLNVGGSAEKVDLTQLAGLPLEALYITGTQVSDLSPLKDLPLTVLHCGDTKVFDLSPLRGLKLTNLSIRNTRVFDLTPINGMPLEYLNCQGAPVADLTPLKNSPLTEIHCDFLLQRDAKILRTIRTLEKINDMPAADVLKKGKKK